MERSIAAAVSVTAEATTNDRAIPIDIAGDRNVGAWRVKSRINVFIGAPVRRDGNALRGSIRWANPVELQMTRPAIVSRSDPSVL